MLSTEQVNILLDSIDRGNPIGKRNYAIIMMAACLGMRDSDIVNLKFDNIDWEKSTISFFLSEENKQIFSSAAASRGGRSNYRLSKEWSSAD